MVCMDIRLLVNGRCTEVCTVRTVLSSEVTVRISLVAGVGVEVLV